MPWNLIRKAFGRDASKPDSKSRNTHQPLLCLGGKSKASKNRRSKSLRQTAETQPQQLPPPLPGDSAGDAVDEFVFELFDRRPEKPPIGHGTMQNLSAGSSGFHRLEKRGADEAVTTLAYCPHCCSVVVPVGPAIGTTAAQHPQQSSRTGIRTNPWTTIRMQKSLDSGISEELNRLSASAVVASDEAADMEVSAINSYWRSATVGRRRSTVLEGVARRGYVQGATWQAAATIETVAQSSSSPSTPSEQLSPAAHSPSRTEFDSPAASSSSLAVVESSHFLEGILSEGSAASESHFADQLDRCRRELMLRALASVRDRLELEMAHLVMATGAGDHLMDKADSLAAASCLTNGTVKV